MSFDLESLEMSDRGEYQMVDAKGNDVIVNGVPFTVTIASPGTPKAVAAAFKRDEARSARVLGSMAGKASKRTVQDEYRERADFLMEVIEGTSISDFTYQGKTGSAALRAMLMNPKQKHNAEGMLKYHEEVGNFSADSVSVASNTSDTQHG